MAREELSGSALVQSRAREGIEVLHWAVADGRGGSYLNLKEPTFFKELYTIM